MKYNIDVLCDYICNFIPLPLRDFTEQPKMIVIRSFDVNNPGSEVWLMLDDKERHRNFQVHELKGGVCGGSLMRGVLVLGQEIEIRPGVTVRDDANNSQVFPTKSKIMSLKSDKNDLQVTFARFSWDKIL